MFGAGEDVRLLIEGRVRREAYMVCAHSDLWAGDILHLCTGDTLGLSGGDILDLRVGDIYDLFVGTSSTCVSGTSMTCLLRKCLTGVPETSFDMCAGEYLCQGHS